MEIATRSKVSGVDSGSAERSGQKRKVPSPPHSSNGHSPSETSPSPMKKKKKPGAMHSSKDQDGRNDFYCWVCHREGQVLCCELCPRVYHAKCLKLAAEPEGDWFCPECEKITVAECIETQSKAMTMLTLDQLSYLLKFALQKMKQPGDQPRSSAHSPHATASQRKAYNWTEPFQKPVSLEQHPDYAEYIFHPMDLCTLEKNVKKKMYGCTEAFLADVKWILHNCIIYNGGNHKLTATAKVIVRICEHEMNEIEVCPECYLSACQKRDNWFCEPCSNPHPLVWAKLKGFPFWPAKALRDKDGQVDARFFGQHDRAWVPINNCYLMSKEIPFSVKKTKSIFNSAMQEMEVYVENIRKKFGVFNYAPFRTPYTPDNHFQMLLDPANPAAGSIKPEKQEKIKFNFDMTASPKMHLGKSMLSASGGAGGVGMGVGVGRSTARRISVTDMPRSPMSTNSSGHTGSDGEQEGAEKGQAARPPSGHYSTGEESQDCTASPAPGKSGVSGMVMDSPKPFHSQAPTATVKQEKGPPTPSILNLNLDRSKAEMDLKELSESVQQQQQQQQQGAPPLLTSPKRQIRSRFQLNLDKTIENCKAQLGINEISEDAYKGVEDSEESDKSDSSDSEYGSDDEQKPNKDSQEPGTATAVKSEKDASKKKAKTLPPSSSSPSAKEQDKPKPEGAGAGEGSAATATATATTAIPKSEPASKTGANEPVPKDRQAPEGEKETSERPKAAPEPPSTTTRDKAKASQEPQPAPAMDADLDSDSDKELVIDLGDDHGERGRKRGRKDSAAASTSTSAVKEASAATKADGKAPITTSAVTPSQQHAPVCSSPGPKDLAQPSASTPASILSFPAAPLSSSTPLPGPAASSSSSSSSTSASTSTPLSTVKKQRPLLPRETVPVVQHAVVWNPTTKFQTSSQKWHMQKVQRQQQPAAQAQTQAQTQPQTPPQRSQQVLATAAGQQQQASSSSSSSSSSASTRYQTRQAVKAVQQKDLPHSVSTSSVTLVGGSPVSVAIAAATPSMSSSSSSSSPAVMATDLHIPTASADVAADIAKYTNKIMDAIKGTMTELYNDLSKSTSGNTIAEIRRLRIEIEKLQWLHQQELSEMKHNLELTMAEMRQSLEQERERLVAEVRKQMEAERQQAVDETKKKQWCANCRKEAIFYCCWNTSYCDYPCQQAHWPEHMKSCTQSATASQQEPETEQCTDTPAKVCGQPAGTHNSPREGGAPSAPTPQDLDLDKSKDSVTVSLA